MFSLKLLTPESPVKRSVLMCQMQELTYMTELAENITILKQTVEQLQESDMENKQQLARIWELLKNSGQEGLA